MLMTVKSLSFVARITGNWESLLVTKGVAFHGTPLDFCRVQTNSGESNVAFRGEHPTAGLKEIERMFKYYIDREVICQEKYGK